MDCQIKLVYIKLGIIDRGWDFLPDFLIYKLRPDFSINKEETGAFSIEIIDKNSDNLLIVAQCRHPSSKGKIFKEYLKKIFRQSQNRK